MVEKAARGGNDDSRVLAELLDLVVHRSATDQNRVFCLRRNFVKALVDLEREFTGRNKNQAAALELCQTLEHRNPEGHCFSGSGLGDPDDVFSPDGHGDGLLLNRGRNLEAEPGQGIKNLRSDPKPEKRRRNRGFTCRMNIHGEKYRDKSRK